MKKISFILFTILFTLTSYSQTKYYTKNGHITFEASVPSFEEIKAQNNSTTVVLNTETNEIAALALMKGFRFEIALMEEHFNENYAESDEYPKATFKGKIENLDASKLTNKKSEYTLKGTLKIRGKEKLISTIAYISKESDIINIVSEFSVKPNDFNIKIPSIVQEKISEEIKIEVSFKLQKK